MNPNPQRFLVLDDDPVRHQTWAKMFKAGGHESVHAHTIEEFSAALATGKFNTVFLDHDLNDHPHLWVSRTKDLHPSEVNPVKLEAADAMFIPGVERVFRDYQGFRKQNGQDACWLLNALPAELRPDKIVIHSWNDYGAMCMTNSLKNDGGYTRIVRKEFPINLYFKAANIAEREIGYQSPMLQQSRSNPLGPYATCWE
jgi:CheY-like chemotaxis protein